MFSRSFFSQSKSTSVVFFFVTILLIAICDFVFFFKTQQYSLALLGALACLGLLFLPVFLFKKNLRLYLKLLLPIFLLIPFDLGSIILFGAPINDSTILLVLNTNFHEAMEIDREIFVYTNYRYRFLWCRAIAII